MILAPFFSMIGTLGRLGQILTVVGRALNVVGDMIASILSRLPMVTAAVAENIGAFINGAFWAVGISFGIQAASTPATACRGRRTRGARSPTC